MEMVEGFLLDRIDGQRTGLGIDLADQHTALIAPTAAEARLAISDPAMMRTELTAHQPIFQPFIIPAFHQKTIAS